MGLRPNEWAGRTLRVLLAHATWMNIDYNQKAGVNITGKTKN
jgi:hypothetical protein